MLKSFAKLVALGFTFAAGVTLASIAAAGLWLIGVASVPGGPIGPLAQPLPPAMYSTGTAR